MRASRNVVLPRPRRRDRSFVEPAAPRRRSTGPKRWTSSQWRAVVVHHERVRPGPGSARRARPGAARSPSPLRVGDASVEVELDPQRARSRRRRRPSRRNASTKRRRRHRPAWRTERAPRWCGPTPTCPGSSARPAPREPGARPRGPRASTRLEAPPHACAEVPGAPAALEPRPFRRRDGDHRHRRARYARSRERGHVGGKCTHLRRRRGQAASGCAGGRPPLAREVCRCTRSPADETVIHVLWINAGLSCDGDSVALTGATQPSIEEIALGALPGPAEDRGPLAADRLRVRPERRCRRLPRVVLQGGPRRARALRADRRGVDPQRGHQEARATGAASATTPTPTSR